MITGWARCPGCGFLLYGKGLARNLNVCPECRHHFPIGVRERIAQLTDPDSFLELDRAPTTVDPLGFADRLPYPDRLAGAVAATGEAEAAVAGTARIHGRPVVLLAMEFAFLGGSMGAAVGEAVARCARTARATRTPLVLVCASGGARMQEGVVSLLQMAKTAQEMALLHEAGVLSICVLTDPTFGGVTASYAMLGDVVVAESGALVGFAGPRVIEQTVGQRVRRPFQTAEFLLRHGLVDRVERREALRPLLSRLLALHSPAEASGPQRRPGLPPIRDVAGLPSGPRDPWEVVREARTLARPTALDYLRDAFDDFVELHGDRCFGDDPAIVGGVARIGGRSVVVAAHQKAHDTADLVARNFGMSHPEGYRKVLRLFEHAERFGMPVVALVDTPGAYPGIEAEERGQAGAIAAAIMRSARLRVPFVSIVTGEGGSGGALALATSDRLLMLENSFYSVISPEGCAAILWRTPDAAPEAARALGITSFDLLSRGIADAVVPEPPGGAHTDPAAAAANLRRAVLDTLDELAALDSAELLATRYERFARAGQPAEGEAGQDSPLSSSPLAGLHPVGTY